MEESAEAPPAVEEARRFRGSVPTAGRGSGWEPADTTVSAEEHAKKITTQMGGDLCDCPQVLLFVRLAYRKAGNASIRKPQLGFFTRSAKGYACKALILLH